MLVHLRRLEFGGHNDIHKSVPYDKIRGVTAENDRILRRPFEEDFTPSRGGQCGLSESLYSDLSTFCKLSINKEPADSTLICRTFTIRCDRESKQLVNRKNSICGFTRLSACDNMPICSSNILTYINANCNHAYKRLHIIQNWISIMNTKLLILVGCSVMFDYHLKDVFVCGCINISM